MNEKMLTTLRFTIKKALLSQNDVTGIFQMAYMSNFVCWLTNGSVVNTLTSLILNVGTLDCM